MKRTVIKIDETLCNGCGACVSGCHEGALQLINGKAVVISDLYCDGLGACIGDCPVGAISLEEREAQPYDEISVMERLTPKGEAAILAHLKHLHEHGEHTWCHQGIDYLKKHGIEVDLSKIGLTADGAAEERTQTATQPLACGCPGSTAREIRRPAAGFAMAHNSEVSASPISELQQFPIQLHLVNPGAGFLQDADMLLAADCTAFACGDFHRRLLRGKSLVIACPKLDSNTQTYIDKLTQMIDQARINTLTVAVMEVPCCQGLVRIAQAAREQAQRHLPIKIVVLSVGGETISDKWI